MGLRTVLACAVPAVTALFGIFWFFSRKKEPPPKKIKEPSDKETEAVGEDVSEKQETAEEKTEATKAEKLASLGCGDVLAAVREKQKENDEIISEIDNAFKEIYEDSELLEEDNDENGKEEDEENKIESINEEINSINEEVKSTEENVEGECKDGLNTIKDATKQSDINEIDEEKIITRQRACDLNMSCASQSGQSVSEGNNNFKKDEPCLEDEAIVSATISSLSAAPVSSYDPIQVQDSFVKSGSSETIEDLVLSSSEQPLNAKTADNVLIKNVEKTVVGSEQTESQIESQIITENVIQSSVPISASSRSDALSKVDSDSLQKMNSSEVVNSASKTGSEENCSQKDETNVNEAANLESQNNLDPLDNNRTSLEPVENNESSEVVDWAADQNAVSDWDDDGKNTNAISANWVEETSNIFDSGIDSNSSVVNGEVEQENSESVQQQTAVENVISPRRVKRVGSSPGRGVSLASSPRRGVSSNAPGAYVSRERRGRSLNSSESSSNCDSSSVASSGSSHSGNTPDIMNHQPDEQEHIFEFNLPSDLCGLFIGTRGKTIKSIRDQSGARLKLRNNPYTPDFQICVIEGTQSAIDKACSIIKRKFPAVKYPGIDLSPINSSPVIDMTINNNPVLMPEIMQLSLPEGVSVDVVVSSIVDAGRIFIQQPTHPSYTSLDRLNHFMLQCYMQDGAVPDIPRPIENGVICAAPMLNGWYRAQIMGVYDETDECDIKYVDYGGYSRISSQCLKQIRSDFMTLPFEAVECYMANITPLQGEGYFSPEAAAILEELTQGKLLQAQVVGRADDGIPYVHIYQISGNNSALMVNREMVNRGVVRWIEILT